MLLVITFLNPTAVFLRKMLGIRYEPVVTRKISD